MQRKTKRSKKAFAPDNIALPFATKTPCFIVAMGASAGGLEVFQQFFDVMPANSGMAFFLIQHLEPNHETLMPSLLGKHTTMPVSKVKNGGKIEANHVYVIAPNASLSVEKGTMRVLKQKEGNNRSEIDFSFRSMAEDQGENVIGIVLSGIGTDGTIGLKAIKEHGGLTLAQSLETAKYDSMPRSAISTGLVDYILPVEKMAAKIVEYRNHLVLLKQRRGTQSVQQEAIKHLPKIISLLRHQTSHDFGRYKQSTLIRRIQRRMQMQYANTVRDYVHLLRKDSKEVENLFKDLLIGVTQFFRDTEAFESLAKEVIPKLFADKTAESQIRVWVPGCASGEEAYSIAILLAEHMAKLKAPPRVQIFGSDLDTEALSFARKARYAEEVVDQISAKRLARFFKRKGDRYEVNEQIREMCVFSPHNLIKDPPFSRLDLISCRNLLIYLESDLQKRLLPLFHYALNPSGFLFLGPSENIASRSELFRPLDKKHRTFQRKPSVLQVPANVPLLDPGRLTRIQPFVAPQFSLPKEQSIARTIERVVLEDYAPASVIINEQGEVMYFSGRTGKFLEQPSGVPSTKLLNMARKNLRMELRQAIHQSISLRKEIVRKSIAVKIGKETQRINLIVRPLNELGKEAEFFIVLFQETVSEGKQTRKRAQEIAETETALFQHLENELRTTKEDLQTTIEELETSNEELKSANEELLSMNEELQSTNEELQTSKEELQSTNEELQRKVEEVDVANSDLQNFFQSTQVATVFIDTHLRIKKFTPSLTQIFRLMDSDVGRGLLNAIPELANAGFAQDIKEVVDLQVPNGRQIMVGGQHFIARITPYRTADQGVQGTVITFTDITEIKKAEAQRARLASIVESSEDAIIGKSLEGKITTWNTASEKMYGYTMAEAIGFPISLIVPPEKLDELAVLFEKIKQGEQVKSFETKRVSKNGRILTISLTLSPIYDSKGTITGISGIDRDITEEKKTQDALRRNEQLLNDFFENATVGLHWVGPDGTILRANRTEMDLLGYSPNEYIGRNIVEFHADEPVIHEILQRLSCGETLNNFEARLRCKDGSIKTVLISSNVLWEGDRFIHTRCFTRDITELKRAQEALSDSEKKMAAHAQNLEKEVSQRTANLKETVTALEGVCYTIAHDLRAPLRAVQGFTKILQDDYSHVFDEPGKEFAGRIVSAAVRMDVLIKDLLDYARLSHMDLPLQSLETNYEVTSAIEHLREEIKLKNAEVSAKPLPRVLANHTVLQQVLNNLIGNALKFILPDTTPKIYVYGERHGDKVKIFVMDNGIGITPENHERVFGLFYRLHDDRTYPGTGLGLAIVKKGIERMGGQVKIEPSVNGGTCFCLELRSGE